MEVKEAIEREERYQCRELAVQEAEPPLEAAEGIFQNRANCKQFAAMSAQLERALNRRRRAFPAKYEQVS